MTFYQALCGCHPFEGGPAAAEGGVTVPPRRPPDPQAKRPPSATAAGRGRGHGGELGHEGGAAALKVSVRARQLRTQHLVEQRVRAEVVAAAQEAPHLRGAAVRRCLLYTSPSPRD